MNKKPTDFSQISLLSDQKAKLIVMKNSIENIEHVKLCKRLELAKHGMRASHGKKKKDLEKRLERHVQDSLNIDDIKGLHKYVGDARNENEFCSNFESGRSHRSILSVQNDRKGLLSAASELSKLETRSNFSENRGKVFISNGRQGKAKPNKISHSSNMPRWEESDFDSVNSVTNEVCPINNRHFKTCLEGAPDAKSGSRSTKVQRHINGANKQNHNEMLSRSTAKSAAEPVSLRQDDITNDSKNVINAEAVCENLDDNINSLECGITFSNKEEKGLQDFDLDNEETATDLTQNKNKDNRCTGKSVGEAIGKQRQESKRNVMRKRLGPTPKECEEDVDGELFQGEDDTNEMQNTSEQSYCVSQVSDDRASMTETQKEIPSGSSNVTPTRRRRASWAGRSTTELRLFKRNEFNELLPALLSNTSESGNGTIRPGLGEWDKGKSPQKTWETRSSDPRECSSTSGVDSVTRERRQGCERFGAGERIKPDVCLQKSHSLPTKLGAQRSTIYSEEPFYIRPRKLTRRISWQSTKLTEETLKGLREIADKAKSESETTNDEPKTSLVNILPPITLPTIYAQQCSKEKREHESQDRKQRSTREKCSGEEKLLDLDILKDCRYLRFRKDKNP